MTEGAVAERVPVGVVVVGHGESASHLLRAARAIAEHGLSDLVAIDAGDGETPALEQALCDGIERADRGRGVLLIVDLLGSSPCRCGLREASGHVVATLAGLNLAMLLKLASLDRLYLGPEQLAQACAESGRRSVVVSEGVP